MKYKEIIGLFFIGIYFIVGIWSVNIFFEKENKDIITQKITVIPKSSIKAEEKVSKGTQNLEGDYLSNNEALYKDNIQDMQVKNVYISGDEDYFADAVFIGDSRTESFGIQSEIKDINCYAKKGLSVNSFFEWKIVNLNGKQKTILEALSKKQFRKIYIMLGYNELGWPTEYGFIKKYREVIEEIKKLQPNAIIYIQSIIYVSKEQSDTEPYENNENIIKRNQAIETMANDLGCYYLDINQVLSDKRNNLIDNAATDGIHLTKKYLLIWKQFLLDHIVEGT